MPPTRSPLVSGLLSAICAGLGQLHCGHLGRGLAWLGASTLLLPIGFAATWSRPTSDGQLVTLLGFAVGTVLVTLAAVVDAVRLARRAAPVGTGSGGLGARGGLALLFLVAGLAGPALSIEALRANVAQAYLIPTSSMAPDLLAGDRILADKTDARLARLSYGDLVLFPNPEDRQQLYVKRLVALPGDVVEVRDGVLLLGGQALPRLPLTDSAYGDLPPGFEGSFAVIEWNHGTGYRVLATPGQHQDAFGPLTIPPGTCFVLGDHRANSRDSRAFGLIPMEDIEAVARHLFWPAHDLRRFGALETRDSEADLARRPQWIPGAPPR